MALSGYSRRRRRGRFGLAVAKWGAALAVVCVAAAFVYEFGRRQGAGDVSELERQVETLDRERQALAAENARIAEALNGEHQRLTELHQAYDSDVPRGPIRELNALIAQRMAAGMTPAELRATLAAAEPAHDCADAIERKRLRVGFDAASIDEGRGSFGDGALTIRITGTMARNGAGDPEAWYDADQPVTVEVVRPWWPRRVVEWSVAAVSDRAAWRRRVSVYDQPRRARPCSGRDAVLPTILGFGAGCRRPTDRCHPCRTAERRCPPRPPARANSPPGGRG